MELLFAASAYLYVLLIREIRSIRKLRKQHVNLPIHSLPHNTSTTNTNDRRTAIPVDVSKITQEIE